MVARNRKARHDYEILDRIEAGLVLLGSEIKSIRDGKVSLREGHVRIERGEAWLMGVNIAPYPQSTHVNHEPLRPRKLLLHHREIEKLRIRVEERGLTIVPLSLYLKRGRAKVEIAVARGRTHGDRRHEERRRQEERDAAREVRRIGGE
jgi:SsrA-binding protein